MRVRVDGRVEIVFCPSIEVEMDDDLTSDEQEEMARQELEDFIARKLLRDGVPDLEVDVESITPLKGEQP